MSSDGSDCTRETSRARRRRCWRRIAPGGIPNRVWRWYVWPKATRPPQRPPSETPSSAPWGALQGATTNTHLQRAPLLEAQIEIELATGDLGRARSAADELELIAARFQSRALVASAALARGRVRLADGDAAGAEQSLSEAVRRWNEVGAPYETAIARMASSRRTAPAAASTGPPWSAKRPAPSSKGSKPRRRWPHQDTWRTTTQLTSSRLRVSTSFVARVTTGR
jgi:hypothetical protein